jgi:hypothetical protein
MTTKQRRKHFPRSKRRGRIAANSGTLSSSKRELLAIPKADWAIAKRQERIVKAALRTSVGEAADRAGRSTRTVLRLMARYRVNPTLLAFLPRKRGLAVGSCRFAFKTRLFAFHDATSHCRLQRRIRLDLYMNS